MQKAKLRNNAYIWTCESKRLNAMKKLLLSLAAALVLASLGFFGWKAFGPEKVRERITTREGTNVVSEELSYYLEVTD